MIDTHAHIHDPAFDNDREAVLGCARDAGVTGIVTVGCDVDDSRRALAVAHAFGLAATIGIHPHEAKGAPADIAAAFDELVAASPLAPVAIGETGLDYYYDHSPRARQRDVLVAQMRYARARDLPLVFHVRDAFGDFVEVLRAEFAPGQRGIVHCFTGTADEARTYTQEFGLALGIGGVVTFASANGLREAVRAVDPQFLVLETDAPYLAPVPHRGKRNEPAFVIESARRLAAERGTTVDDVASQTTANARRILGRASANG